MIFLHLIVAAGMILHPGIRPTEQAIEHQANHEFRQGWHTAPIRWGKTGIDIIVSNQIVQTICGTGYGGCHWADANGPHIAVRPGGWDMTLSHEVLETLVDPTASNPTGAPIEVCDPVNDNGYTFNRSKNSPILSDFVFPSFFVKGSTGRKDYLGKL